MKRGMMEIFSQNPLLFASASERYYMCFYSS